MSVKIWNSGAASSPSGSARASVSSSEYSDGRSVTQVILENRMGGSGLVAFYEARVNLGLEWGGDEELIVRIPKELPTHHTGTTSSRNVRITYVEVPAEQIAPMTWTLEQEIKTGRAESREAGTIVAVGERYRWDFYDRDERADWRAQGLQGGGETWAAVVQALVVMWAPDLQDALELDPEADGLAVWSSSLEPLRRVAALVAETLRKPASLSKALSRAAAEGWLE